MKFVNVTSMDKAKEIIRTSFNAKFATKNLPLSEAKGKICAKDIYSHINIPSFNKSTVDGFALRAEDTLGASDSIPTMLKLQGSVHMGVDPNFSLMAGECAYIPTGGALPQGANAAAMIEYTDVASDLVCLYKPLSYNENVTLIGDDIGKGDLITQKGKQLSAFDLGLLASVGYKHIEVALPTAAIISTGDELERGDKLGAAKIFDSNNEMLAAMGKDMGVEVVSKIQLEDNPIELTQEIAKAAQAADFVLITGGSSVGERDFTLNCIEDAGGEILIKGLALKPGKPTIIASLYGKPIFGLSGNPVSAAVAFLLLAPAFLPCKEPTKAVAKAAINFASTPGRLTFQPVRLEDNLAHPILGKSGILSSLAMADGYLLISECTEGINQGEDVEVYLL